MLHAKGFALGVAPERPHPYDPSWFMMNHMEPYAVKLYNSFNVQADAELYVDGLYVATFRLDPYETKMIERKTDDTGCFTATLVGTHESYAAEIEAGNSQNGLIKCTFWKARKPIPPVKVVRADQHVDHDEEFYSRSKGFVSSASPVNSSNFSSMSVGVAGAAGFPSREMGTSLTGKSGQRFISVGPIDRDPDSETTIQIRIVSMTTPPPTTTARPLHRVYDTGVPSMPW